MPITVPQYDPLEVAKAAAQMRYGAQETNADLALGRATAQTDLAVQEAQRAGEIARTGTTGAYDLYDKNLAANRANTQQELGQQVQRVGSGLTDAANLNLQFQEAARRRMGGLGGITGQDTSWASDQLQGLMEQFAGRNVQYGAQRQADLGEWAAKHDALQGVAMDVAQQQRAGAMSGLEADILAAISGARIAGLDQQLQAQTSKAQILAEKGAFLLSQQTEAADRQFAQMLQAAGFNLQEQNAIADAAARQASLNMEGQRLQASLDAASREEARANRSDELAWAKFAEDKRRYDQEWGASQGATLDYDTWAQQRGIDAGETSGILSQYTEYEADRKRAMDDIERYRQLQAYADAPADQYQMSAAQTAEYNRLRQQLPKIEYLATADPVARFREDYGAGYTPTKSIQYFPGKTFEMPTNPQQYVAPADIFEVLRRQGYVK